MTIDNRILRKDTRNGTVLIFVKTVQRNGIKNRAVAKTAYPAIDPYRAVMRLVPIW